MPPTHFEGRVARRIRGRNTLLGGCATSLVVVLLTLFAYFAWANVLPPLEADHRVYPNPNGYEACAAAVSGLPGLPSTGAPWTSAPAALRRDLEPVQPRLAALSAAVRLPYLAPPRNSDNFSGLARYREACRQLSAQARLELVDGHPGAAIQRALDAVELGAKMGRGGSLIDSLVGIACAAIGQNAAERCISRLSATEARAAGQRLDGILAQLPEPVEVMREERRQSLWWARSVFAGRTPIVTSPASLGDPTNWVDDLWARGLLLVYPKSWGYAQVDRYWRAVETELRKPYAARTPPKASPPEWDPVLGGSSMELSTMQVPFARGRAYLRLLRVELALREYRVQAGAFPDSLQQLVPAHLAQVPQDPFNDQDLKYRRRGVSYLLYSVGPDLKDNAGTPIAWAAGPTAPGDLVAGKLFTRPKNSTAPPAKAP